MDLGVVVVVLVLWFIGVVVVCRVCCLLYVFQVFVDVFAGLWCCCVCLLLLLFVVVCCRLALSFGIVVVVDVGVACCCVSLFVPVLSLLMISRLFVVCCGC